MYGTAFKRYFEMTVVISKTYLLAIWLKLLCKLLTLIALSLSMSNIQNILGLWYVPRKTSPIKTTNNINKQNSILRSQ